MKKLLIIAVLVAASLLGFNRILAQAPTASPTPKNASQNHTLPTFDQDSTQCQRISDVITKRTSNLMNAVDKVETAFDSISQRVQDFYNNTLAPQNKTLTNFTQLVSDIDTKKDNLEKLVQQIGDTNANVACGPLALQQFRGQVVGAFGAINAYKASIKNLITAVYPLSEDEQSESVDEQSQSNDEESDEAVNEQESTETNTDTDTTNDTGQDQETTDQTPVGD